MSLLFAEHGVDVHFFDPSEENVHKLTEMAKTLKTNHKILHESSYEQLCKSIESSPDEPRLFVFSIPHGDVGDKTVDSLSPHLKKGDLILDCSNEHWKNTERRQAKLEPKGIHYVGCGVSGGYQSARHGPSMSPGGSPEALDKVLPFLRRVAAKDKQGRPCTTAIGPAGSGHYVKMIHNGIEQGMMSAIAEMWYIMTTCLNMTYEEVATVFEDWNTSDPLRDNFLISIGVDINRTKDDDGNYVLANVRDKVVQDVNESEGTGTWSCEQSVQLHVPAPTIVSAHMFRLASADAARRESVKRSFKGGVSPKPLKLEVPEDKSRPAFIEDLKMALYAAFLSAFTQGIHIIRKADKTHNWNLDYASIIGIWRGGCIIQSDYISDLLASVFEESDSSNTPDDDILSHTRIGDEFTKAYPSLKNVVLKATEADAYVPSLSATLEFCKYSASTELPTQFMEAELDYFGSHMYELKSEAIKPGVESGDKHHEWKPARGIFDDDKS